MTKVPEGTVTTETSKAAVQRIMTRLAEGYTLRCRDGNGFPIYERGEPGGIVWRLYAVQGTGRQWHIVEYREDKKCRQ